MCIALNGKIGEKLTSQVITIHVNVTIPYVVKNLFVNVSKTHGA